MPKIEVNEKLFFELVGKKMDSAELETKLESAKAELDEWDKTVAESERVIKIELNDTNRPDLWSTAGLARHLRVYDSIDVIPVYDFFSSELDARPTNYHITVDESVKSVRPFLAAFIISGKGISDAMLRDAIQTQEKLCSNFGRKRKSVSMGMYRINLINWPIVYKAADPDSTSFTPLQMEKNLSLRDILKQHPKGIEYGAIISDHPLFPILEDAKGGILSMAPIINSADIGAVQVGDTNILVEFTGTDIASIALAANIVACDFYDTGYEIKPVRVDYPDDTPLGRSVTFPYYFQKAASVDSAKVKKLLGENMNPDKIITTLLKMGIRSESHGQYVKITPPPYRDDFLHAVDIIEDVMIGRGMASFQPERPKDFTIGRLSAIELFTRKVKELFVGLNYQEMIYNYLGSAKDYINKMNINSDNFIKISNPMTENYEYVRTSILPSLLQSESVSSKAVYPHKIFEAGKVAFIDTNENYGSTTRQYLGFLSAHQNADYNELASTMSTVLYYFNVTYSVAETTDSRFLLGRQAALFANGKYIGIFGEVNPVVLENWGITMPCAAGEIDLDELLAIINA